MLVYELSVVVLGIVLTFIVGHLGDIIKEFKGLFKFFLIDPKLKILKILIEYLPRLKLLIDKKGIKYIMNIEDDNLDSDPKGLDRPTYDKSIISLNGSLGSTSLNQLENLAKDYIGILQCYQVLFANWFPQSAHTNISSLITDDEKKIFDSQIKKYKVDLILTSQGYQDYCNKYSIPVNPDLIQNPKNMI